MSNQENSRISKENEHLWRQFCKLGEMMGDGLHYEADGKWIAKEYRQLARVLIPKIKEQEAAERKMKNEAIDIQITKLLTKHKCSCGGNLKQKRSGTKIVYCEMCNNRYRITKKKKR